MKPLILHLSNDYPDPLYMDKTQAVLRLVEDTPEYRHVVYSLNRVNGLGGITSIPFGEDRTAVAYGALPKGIGWERRLRDLAHWISADLKRRKIVPDLIQAHKITVEGLIGQQLADEYHCPLICDIQGGTDVTVLKVKLGLRKRYREIVKRSALIFPYAPWSAEPFERLAGMRREQYICLPVVPGFDGLKTSLPSPSPRLVTMTRFGDAKRKNTPGIIRAMQALTPKYPTLTLDIYGGGAARCLFQLKRLIEKCGLTERVNFKGPVPNGALPEVLGQYSASVTPSFLETYGLVYAEALMCGVPVLFSKGRAIEGYFDTPAIGYAADPNSASDIAAGIDCLLTNEARLKQNIASMQASGALNLVRRSHIIDTYRQGLERVLQAGRTEPVARKVAS